MTTSFQERLFGPMKLFESRHLFDRSDFLARTVSGHIYMCVKGIDFTCDSAIL